jgi:hypothetical protein
MKIDLIKAKLKASGIHLAISAMIFVGILYLILVEWYPEPFFTASGGWSGIKLMAAVDLVLGPSLTFIIFNNTKAKREIVMDLSIIAVVQFSALIWGGMQVYSERPVALVMWEGIFYTVTEDYYNKQDLSLDDIAGYSEEKPLIILAETDHSVAQLEEIQRLNQQKIPPYAQVHLYQSIKDNVDLIMPYQMSEGLLKKYIEKTVPDTEHHVFLGKAKHSNLLVYLDKDASLVKIELTP